MTAFGMERDRDADIGRFADQVMEAASAWSDRHRARARALTRHLVADTQTGYDRDCAGWAILSILTDRVGQALTATGSRSTCTHWSLG